MVKTINKNTSIEAMRFLFMSMLCVHHSHFWTVMQHGYLAVEFFFILSGVFLYRTFLSNNSPSTIDYTIARLKKFYLKYIVALVITMAVLFQRAMGMVKDGQIVDYIKNVFNDIFMLSSTGIYQGGVNDTMWYLVVLLIGGTMLYASLKYNSRLSITVVLPLVSLLYYTYVFNTGDSIERWGSDIFIYHPLWRGIADMSIGVIFWHFFTRVENKLNVKLVGIISIVALVAIISMAFCKKHLDSYVLIIIPVLLAGCFYSNSLLNRVFRHPVWAFLGGITFEMYLIHIAVIRLAWFAYGRIHLPLLVFIILYLLAVVFAAWGLKSTVEYMTRSKWKKLV